VENVWKFYQFEKKLVKFEREALKAGLKLFRNLGSFLTLVYRWQGIQQISCLFKNLDG